MMVRNRNESRELTRTQEYEKSFLRALTPFSGSNTKKSSFFVCLATKREFCWSSLKNSKFRNVIWTAFSFFCSFETLRGSRPPSATEPRTEKIFNLNLRWRWRG